MINETLVFLADQLNEYLSAGSSDGTTQALEKKVVFLDGETTDPVSFKLGAVTALMINLEEETTLRAADRYRRDLPDGAVVKVQPDVRLNLYVLFVARFKLYEQSLHYLSMVIRYFQSHRVLDHGSAPSLSDKIEKLLVELETLPFSEQSEVWSTLRTTYLPSVLYKVSMVVFRDEGAVEAPVVVETDLASVP